MPRQNSWLAVEDARLRDLITQGLTSDVIAIRLGRSVSSVRNRAKRMGLGFGTPVLLLPPQPPWR